MPSFPFKAGLPLLVWGLLAAPAARPADPPAKPVDFNRDVRPILSDTCFACHGFDAKARKAQLRLDTPEGAFAERKGVTPIKPGDPKGSEVWARLTSADADTVMPPPHSNKKLTDAQKETIRRWIEQGAKYQKHWSFEPIRRPAAPAVAARSPIDAFLLERMKPAGLTPRPVADKETLIRRVSFALTGLPPTIADIDAFLADTSATAYEKLVDRYLASPRYGEEMARHWLDVARYADTHGLHLDNERQMWAYRDWVVRAFNENLPFAKFTVWQLAGDMLPTPTPDQLTATGFNRCNVTTGEGGSIESEWVYRNAVDRTTTAVQAFLGLTAGCAVCHDHKFDPLSQKEYYSLYAFFLNDAGPALDGNVSTHGPFVKLPTPDQKLRLDTATKAEEAARKRLEEAAAKAEYTDPADAKPAPEKQKVVDTILDDAFPLGATSRNTTRNAPDWVDHPACGPHSGRRVLRQANSFFHEDAIQFKVRPVVVPGNAELSAWVWLDPGHPPAAVALQAGGAKVRWGAAADGAPYKGKGKKADESHLGPLPKAGEWAKLTATAADLGLKDGQTVGTLTLQVYGGVVYWDEIAVRGETNPAADPLASFKVWWKSQAGKPAPPEVPAELRGVLNGGPDKKHTPEQAAKLRTFYLAVIARPLPVLSLDRTAWEVARAGREAADAAIPGTMIFRDRETPRDAHLMTRGQYDKPGTKVTPGVPAVLPPLKPAGDRPTRLDLANWVVSPENPLTARVAVNRLWQQFFGVGLVKTSADFGAQGEPPSHPELLDWLAAEYRESGWDTKRFVKRLLMSDAFRRDTMQPPAERAKDPENRLLSRGPRFRLDAEQLRDNALFVSGLINLEVGGHAVKPYQPPNIWEPVGYGDSNTRYYLQDRGPANHRRSLYVFIKRTAPHPFLTNFDAPNREQLCAVRDRTNTPLQALQLMNDVQHVEAARALAERVLTEGGKTDSDRIIFLYRTVLARKPDADELRLLAAALAKQRALYAADPAAAAKLVALGESKSRNVAPTAETAAWAMTANLVLNLDETVSQN